MTEVVASEVTASRLSVNRWFTQPDADPYDSLEWERRDAQIGSGEKIAFRQEGVEFPKSWSLTASNIVAQKYFRGKLGTPERETSLRQMIWRIVSTITDWGVKFGYFDDETAHVFCAELTHILLNQYAAFNSPVQFNIGVKGRPQTASACFILDLQDNMESIEEWIVTEAEIFRAGSGSGVNLSRLREDGAPLSRGGTSSGPMSFVRWADAGAGAIKSGGSSRRAAKMIIMDIDHPDVEEFIECKAREERKIRVLRDAGFEVDFDGKDTHTLGFQNANNSVRVTDEFLRAVEEDGDWNLISRVDGHVTKTVKALDLMNKIAAAAWACADPGLQFDTTINNWNTTPHLGKLEASNPCHSGDTRLLTREHGLLRIDGLAELGEFHILNGDGIWAPAHAWSSGVKPIYEVELVNGQKIKLTPDHRIETLRNGIPVEKRVAELKVGDQVLPFLSDRDWTGTFLLEPIDAVMLGYLQGDGTVTGQRVTVANREPEVHEFFAKYGAERGIQFEDDGYQVTSAEGLRPLLDASGFDIKVKFRQERSVELPQRIIPSAIWSADSTTVRQFLRGLFSANGSSLPKHSRITLKTSCREMAEEVQQLLLALGYNAYVTTNTARKTLWDNGEYTSLESYNVNIGSKNGYERFQHEIGFLHEHKSIESEVRSSRSLPRATRVRSITYVGEEEVYDFTEPITHWGWANGFKSHNCAEHIRRNNSSCNLASINLLKFLNDDGTFDLGSYRQVIRVVFTAMDILISGGEFPTEKIKEVTHQDRDLGLGYCNLGALLMAKGLPYDSDSGRAYAAALTSYMTATAYQRSSEMAAALGAHPTFDANGAGNVVQIHTGASQQLHTQHGGERDVGPITRAAWETWLEVVEATKTVGLRNAQATLIAPTGTISFMMDCDTTGMEPDLSLKKTKKLVGGGSLSIVNQTVPRALKLLGYAPDQIHDIVAYIDANSSVKGAPHIDPSHYCVFATAMGDNTIAPMGHVKMMAAIQPGLAGAQSKTVNLPSTATVDDVFNTYMEAWRLGVKCIALYVENSKVAQPVTTDKKIEIVEKIEVVEKVVERPSRHRLPQRRPSTTTSFRMLDPWGSITAEGYLNAGEYPDTHELGEIFVKVAKQGSTLAGVMDAFAIAVSIGLQYGVPVRAFVEKFVNMRFEPNGGVDDPDFMGVTSIMDYLFRRLAADYLTRDERQSLGILTIADRRELLKEMPVSTSNGHGSEESKPVMQIDAPMCYTCGIPMQQAGSCYACSSCGSTSGCS